jgi:protein gp37
MNGKIERLVVQLFGQLPKDQREAVIQQIVAEATKKADDAAMRKASRVSKQSQHSTNSRPMLVVAKTGKDRDAATIRPEPSKPAVLLSGGAHPWGDEFLGSLVPGVRDSDPLDYREKALVRSPRDKEPKRFFVGDIFAAGLSDYIANRHLELFRETDWHTYMVLTRNIHRLSEISNRTDALRLAGNLWIGVSITSSSAFDQIGALGALKTRNKWVSFLPFKSGRPICESSPALEEILRRAGIRWVVFGGDQASGWEITKNDEEEIARASHAAGSPVYCTSIQTLEFFIRMGTVDTACVPGIYNNGTRPRETWKLREFPDFTHPSLSLSA